MNDNLSLQTCLCSVCRQPLGRDKHPDDLEKMNFLDWYRDATEEDLAIARKNNGKKLDHLIRKYAREIEWLWVFHGKVHLCIHQKEEK